MRVRHLFALTLGVVVLVAIAPPMALACPWGGWGHYQPAYGPAYGPGYGPAYGPPAPMYYAPQPYYAPGPGAPQMLPGAMVPTVPVRPMPMTAATVGAADDRFEPPTLTVAPGTTVKWTNTGKHPHTVTDRNGTFDSGDIAPGGTYSVTFQKAGTYHYYCKHHKGMEGTIVVAEPGKAPAGGATKGAGY